MESYLKRAVIKDKEKPETLLHEALWKGEHTTSATA